MRVHELIRLLQDIAPGDAEIAVRTAEGEMSPLQRVRVETQEGYFAPVLVLHPIEV